MASAMCAQRPDRVSGARPARLPTVDTSWQGKASDEDVHGLDLVPVDGGDVAEVRDAGPVAREDGGDGFVEFGLPNGVGVEDMFDGEVKAAVAAEQRPDLESGQLVFLVVHEGSE